MHRLIPAALAGALTPLAALAGTTCNFNVECYMTEPCAGAGWALTVDLDAGVLSTSTQELEILHVDESQTRIVARGAGSLNLLSIGTDLSLFSAHTGAQPAAVTYVGECHGE